MAVVAFTPEQARAIQETVRTVRQNQAEGRDFRRQGAVFTDLQLFARITGGADAAGNYPATWVDWDQDSASWLDQAEVLLRAANGESLSLGVRYLARRIGAVDDVPLYAALGGGGAASGEGCECCGCDQCCGDD